MPFGPWHVRSFWMLEWLARGAPLKLHSAENSGPDGHCDVLMLAVEIFNYPEKPLCSPTLGYGRAFISQEEGLTQCDRTSRQGITIPH